jgi:hypothetical protein
MNDAGIMPIMAVLRKSPLRENSYYEF